MFGSKYGWLIVGWMSHSWQLIQDHSCSVEEITQASQFSITITSLNHDYTDTIGLNGQVII